MEIKKRQHIENNNTTHNMALQNGGFKAKLKVSTFNSAKPISLAFATYRLNQNFRLRFSATSQSPEPLSASDA